jgi:rubredoxin
MSARQGDRDNACIINTAVQVANNPTRISVAAIKGNLTHDMILATGKCNLSPLSTDAPFSLFERFGMQSGRSVDKLATWPHRRGENGLAVLTEHVNGVISLQTRQYVDLGSHGLFLCDVVGAEVLSQEPTMTYSYYHANVKPRPAASTEKTSYVCRICGYVYEGDPLPEDFICPLCKHGAADFEKVTVKTEEKKMKGVCDICGWSYDVAKGDPENGIAPGTAPGDLPEDFVCPVCGVGKDHFKTEQ